MFHDIQIAIIMNFVIVSSVSIKRVYYIHISMVPLPLIVGKGYCMIIPLGRPER